MRTLNITGAIGALLAIIAGILVFIAAILNIAETNSEKVNIAETNSEKVNTHAVTYPACWVEDGSIGPSPCRWDAAEQGNNVGYDVIVRADDAENGIAWDGVRQASPNFCGWSDAWGDPDCAVASIARPGESVRDAFTRASARATPADALDWEHLTQR